MSRLAFVSAEFPPAALARLEALGLQVRTGGWGVTGQVLDATAYAAAAAGASILVTEIEQVDAALLEALGTVELVATARGGPANVDLAACAARGVPVVCTPGRNAESVADFTLGLILALTRGVGAGDRHLRDTGWLVGDELPYLHFRGPELSGLTLGLVGYGAVGRAVARRAEAGFGMRVLFHDPAVEGSAPMATLVGAADVLSLHCPRVPATLGLVDAALLAAMKPTAYLVNTAGGGMVDEDALAAALTHGTIAGAALDVFATEPLPWTSPLRDAPRLLITPHLAGASTDVPRHHAEMICDDVERWLDGRPPARPAVA